MTSLWRDQTRSYRPVVSGFDNDPVTRALLAGAFFMAAYFVVLAPAFLVDQRTVEGVNVWLKPQKFAISLFVHFMTLSILAQLLPRQIRKGLSLSIATFLALGALVLEAGYISVQAARARMSHFNYETDLESLMYAAMGVGAVLLVFVAFVLGVQIWRKADVAPGLKTGAALGLIVGSIATLVLAGYMSMSGSRWIGAHPVDGSTIPIFGWSREVGDLRPAHFVTLHMMQTLPVVGWIADRVRAPAVLAVWAFAFIQLSLAALLFWQALQGKPIWPA